jgi:hypothetical protein
VTQIFPIGTKGQEVDVEPKDFASAALEGAGGLVQMNTVGTITLATAYLEPGSFQIVAWDDQHPEMRGNGWIVAELSTLETAEALHFVLISQLYLSEYGETLREDGFPFNEAPGTVFPRLAGPADEDMYDGE